MILIDTEELVAVNKPVGLPSTGRTTADPDSAQFKAQELLGAPLWALHQLDRDTSGVLLFVRRKSAVAEWQTRWKSLRKRYIAAVHGAFPEPRHIRLPIAPTKSSGLRRVEADSAGKSAYTEVRPLDVAGPYSLVECTLHTGRTHQIRVHLEAIGHPLIGEGVYTDIPCGFHPGPALHALSVISFLPPPLDEVVAPLPQSFQALIEKMGLTLPEEIPCVS